jgi:hypothetical protein
VIDSAHGGTEAWEKSLLEVSSGSIWVLAIKRAEQREGAIVRLQERAGVRTEAKVKSALWGLDHTTTMKPWEIKTVLMKPGKNKRAEVREVSLLEKKRIRKEKKAKAAACARSAPQARTTASEEAGHRPTKTRKDKDEDGRKGLAEGPNLDRSAARREKKRRGGRATNLERVRRAA